MFAAAIETPTPRTRAGIARENGAKSRGPVTPEGKARSARNSATHSLTAANLVCLSTEDQETFNALHQSYIDVWQPANVVEADLVENMAVAKWQEQRCRAIETALLDLQMLNLKIEDVEAQNETLPEQISEALAFMQLADESKALPLLLRYSTEHDRRYHRAMRQLIALRTKGVLANEEKRNEPRTESSPNKPNDFQTTERTRYATHVAGHSRCISRKPNDSTSRPPDSSISSPPQPAAVAETMAS